MKKLLFLGVLACMAMPIPASPGPEPGLAPGLVVTYYWLPG